MSDCTEYEHDYSIINDTETVKQFSYNIACKDFKRR